MRWGRPRYFIWRPRIPAPPPPSGRSALSPPAPGCLQWRGSQEGPGEPPYRGVGGVSAPLTVPGHLPALGTAQGQRGGGGVSSAEGRG